MHDGKETENKLGMVPYLQLHSLAAENKLKLQPTCFSPDLFIIINACAYNSALLVIFVIYYCGIGLFQEWVLAMWC